MIFERKCESAMIKFEDFFTVANPDRTKVKFNMNAGDPTKRAWDFLKKGEDNPDWIGMNAHKTKHANHNLNRCDYLLAFAQYYPYGPDYYIFGGMYKVELQIPEVYNQAGYKLTLMDEFADFRRRLIIRLKKPIGRDILNKPFSSVQRDFDPEVFELARAIKLEDFPGYSNVLLNHCDLQLIVNRDEPGWKNALSSVKGVYCITDKSTGQLYIGSASGDNEGIWQRWSAYASVSNLTGGNKTFEELKKNGADYIIDNFTYSIIEIFDMRTDPKYIIQREEHWKNVFKTVQFGMNNVRTK